MRLLILSHRGVWDQKMLENSFSALKKSFDRSWSVETDVMMTKDDVAVISHDSDLKRLYNKDKVIIESNYEEIEELCTYDTFLEEVKNSNTEYNAIHVKDINESNSLDRTCKRIIEEDLIDKCFLFTNDKQSIQLVEFCKENYPTIRTALHVSEEDFEREILKNVEIVWIDEPGENWVNKGFIDEMHILGKECIIISPEIITPDLKRDLVFKRWREWIDADVNGICTDIPEELEKILNEGNRND